MNALVAKASERAASNTLEPIRTQSPPMSAAYGAGMPADGIERSGRDCRTAKSRKCTESDDALVDRTRTGDAEAFTQLVERYHRRILQLALSFVRNERDAEEVVQDALLRVHLGLTSFRGTSSFYTWLYRIVVNLAIDARRRPQRFKIGWESIAEAANDSRALELPRISDSDPYEALSRMELNQRISLAMMQLPPYHQAVIIMREIDGMSYQEMAESLRISKGTVMSRLFHARKRLQRSLSGHAFEH